MEIGRDVDPGRPAPDTSAVVVGWRCWDVGDSGTLVSPLVTEVWPERLALVARCAGPFDGICVPLERLPHVVPYLYCECGLYARRELPDGYARPGGMLGCVALWGRVIEGENGWRAERGYPLVLFAAPSIADDVRERIADAYGVPVLGLPAEPDALVEFGGADLRDRAEELRVVAAQARRDELGLRVEAVLAEARRVAPQVRADAVRVAARRHAAERRALWFARLPVIDADEVLTALGTLFVLLAVACAATAVVLVVLGLAGVV